MRAHLGAVALALPLALAPLVGAAAAPQVLALVASNGEVPLVCRDGACAAEFSAICLQEARRSPVAGTRYHARGGEGIRVVATTAQGERLGLGHAAELTITTARTHTAVRLSIPLEVLRRHGARSVAVEVGRGVSLVPDAVPGDARPQSEQDLAIATGPLRALAARMEEDAGERVAAARLANRLVSALPEHGRASAALRQSLWAEAEAAAPGASRRSAHLAREAYEDCRARTEVGRMTLRECLGSAHDRFIGDLNNDYWEAVKTGS